MTLKRRGKRVLCFGMMILLMLQLCAARNRQEGFRRRRESVDTRTEKGAAVYEQAGKTKKNIHRCGGF